MAIFGKWLPFVLCGLIYVKTDIAIFLFYNNTYLVIKIMMTRRLDAEIKERQKSLAAILFLDKSAMALYLKIFIRPYSIIVLNFTILSQSAQFPQILRIPLLLIRKNVYSKCSNSIWVDVCIKLICLMTYVEDNHVGRH